MKFVENNIIEYSQLMNLYKSVAWTGYTDFPNKMQTMLTKSLWWCACWDGETLIGLIRVVGDGVSIVYVQDILVDPRYQRLGIGGKLMDKMMATFTAVRQIVLITDNKEETRRFYESVGMQSLEKTHGCGYIRYNFEC